MLKNQNVPGRDMLGNAKVLERCPLGIPNLSGPEMLEFVGVEGWKVDIS